MNASFTRLSLSLVLAGLVMTGCGDEQIQAIGGGPPPDAIVGAVDGVTQGDTPESHHREIVLLHDSSKPLALVVCSGLATKQPGEM